jgi:hypothetical protein
MAARNAEVGFDFVSISRAGDPCSTDESPDRLLHIHMRQ